MKTVKFFTRIFILILCIIAGSDTAQAQEDLQVGKLFDTFGHAKGCKMVVMHNTKLRGFTLQLYKSLVYKTIGREVELYLQNDRKHARKIREVVEDGRITGGYYMMPSRGDINRYVLFSKTSEKAGAVVYMEGDLSPDDVLRIIYYKQ